MKMKELFNLQEFTVKEFQSDFDSLIGRVENGESFIIIDGKKRAVIVPFTETVKFMVDPMVDPIVDDDVVRIHTEHEEGS